jgi:hypothetical protein
VSDFSCRIFVSPDEKYQNTNFSRPMKYLFVPCVFVRKKITFLHRRFQKVQKNLEEISLSEVGCFLNPTLSSQNFQWTFENCHSLPD